MNVKQNDGIVEISVRDQSLTLTAAEGRELFYQLQLIYEGPSHGIGIAEDFTKKSPPFAPGFSPYRWDVTCKESSSTIGC